MLDLARAGALWTADVATTAYSEIQPTTKTTFSRHTTRSRQAVGLVAPQNIPLNTRKNLEQHSLTRSPSSQRCPSITPSNPFSKNNTNTHRKHGSHVLEAVRPPLGKEGDENSDGWFGRCRKDHHSVQVEVG
jgi:hypothetical protein